jgi:ABC-2 type transport system permease protein
VIALFRTELVKATRRARTLVVAIALVGLPILIVTAIKARGDRPRRADRGEGMFRLASQSGLFVPAAVLSVMSGFLLVVIAGSIAGDSVASDATWGNLRYVLMRPVSRAKLLVAKASVAGLLIWLATIVLALAALGAGVVTFGVHHVTVPGVTGVLVKTFTLSSGQLVSRTLLATAYVALGYTALLAIGTFFSTLTDSATGAIGATIGVYIVSEILDGIDQLGNFRFVLPTHYHDVWTDMFTANSFSRDMIAGVIVQAAYLVVFGTLAVVWFRRKDIRS